MKTVFVIVSQLVLPVFAAHGVNVAQLPDPGTFHRVYSIRSVNVDPLWNLVKVTRRGSVSAGESVMVEAVESGLIPRMN